MGVMIGLIGTVVIVWSVLSVLRDLRFVRSASRDAGKLFKAMVDSYALLNDPTNVDDVRKARKILQDALVSVMDSRGDSKNH